ncbi:MAG: insulinase family protein [Bacteroidota bacterium]|nr:insulinase family protein [Bacteroidota bacterium]
MKNPVLSLSTFVLCLFMAFTLSAQDEPVDLSADVPLDPDVRLGQLDNGLTYYIRHNALPENRAEFYLVVNAGSVLEDEDQNGLAHFCEHMAFNGTEHFEKHDIINYLQSIGMKFGPEINAFTSHDVTNYMLQKVPADVPENIDTSLMILFDWANNVSYVDEEIDKERGVVHEEWRTRRGAMFRMQTKTNKVLFQDSKYATHDVIGDIDIIDNAPYEAFKRYYYDWYRPDLQAVIAVGDFDVDLIEKKITEMFGQVPARENPRKREEFTIPDHQETRIAIETDPEAQYLLIQIHYKHDPVFTKNMGYYRESLVHQLYNSMLNKRLQELLQEENPPFIYGFTGYSNLVRTKDSYFSFAVAKNDGVSRTIDALLTENERVKRYGFTGTELERAKKELLSQVEKQYNERDKQKSDAYVWQYYSHFLDAEPVPGIKFDFAFTQGIVPMISLDEINDLAPKWLRDDNRVLVITAPENEDVIIPPAEELILMVESIGDKEIEPYIDKVSDQPLLADIPDPGDIVSKEKNEILGTEEWMFSNGVRVVLKPTDFKEDEILMRAYSFGGSSLYELDDLSSADFASSVIGESGIANFDKIELDKMLAGKILSIYPYVGGVDEGFRGTSSVKDFETLLQMIYLYYTAPPENEKAYNAYMTRVRGFLENRANNPAVAFQDTIRVTLADYHPRVRPLTVEVLDEADFNRLNFIFKDRFGDPGGFNFYFVGNLDLETIEPLLATYLGGLPKVKRNETWRDNGIRPPTGEIDKVLSREMEVPKGTVSITYTGEYDYDNFQDRMNLTALCAILDLRYTESIREEQGGTYGVSVRPVQTHYPLEKYRVQVQFDCDPGNIDKLKGIAYEEIEKIKAEGPLLKDLNNVKENKLKTRAEQLKENNFWMSTIRSMDYDQRDPGELEGYEEAVNSMTIENLKKAANNFFGDNLVEVILLPKNIEDNTANPVMEQQEK